MTDPTPLPITPECRYGHGLLKEVKGDEGLRYVIRSVYKDQPAPGEQVITESPVVFTALLFRCPVCGYLEVFDDEL